ncbi:MAG: alpha/beta fold hydrolase [Byssovorax sp.]
MKRAVLTSFAVLSLTSASLAACGSDTADPTGTTGTGGSGGSTATTTTTTTSTTGTGSSSAACTETKFGGDRPVDLHVPKSYACDKAAPLVILLHGYGASGAIQELYFNLTAESNKRGFLYAHPDGTKNSEGKQFWNATDACCNFEGSKVDDSAYISKLIEDVQAAYNVDAKRIYLIGHSNGGFMSYRMACEHSDQIAGFVSLAGAMNNDVAKCAAATPVSVLQIHGTADETVVYNGGKFGTATYPSAETSVADWVTINKCGATPDTSAAPLDLETTLAGSETKIKSYTGCQAGTGVALWTMDGGSHIPTISASFIPGVIDFLYAHPKL